MSKSKETVYQEATMKSLGMNAEGTRMDIVYAAMEEYSKGQCIAYDEWKEKENIVFRNGKWQRWVPFEYTSKVLVYYTHEELYEAFIKHQSKQP
jgi:hypothetical protein